MAIPIAPIPTPSMLYVCKCSFYTEETGAIRNGTVLLGSNPAVKARPEFFVETTLDDPSAEAVMVKRLPHLGPGAFRP